MKNSTIGVYSGWGPDRYTRNIGDLMCFRAIEKLFKDKVGSLVDMRKVFEATDLKWDKDLIIGGGTVIPNVFFRIPHLRNSKKIVIFGSGVLTDDEIEPANRHTVDPSFFASLDVVGVRGPLSVRNYKDLFNKDVPYVGDLAFAFARPEPVLNVNNEILFFLIENVSPHNRLHSDYVEVIELYKKLAADNLIKDKKKILCLTQNILDIPSMELESFFDEVRTIDTLEDLVTGIENCECIITERLHPAIIAINSGIPFLYLQTTSKSRDLEELLCAESSENIKIQSNFVDMSIPPSYGEISRKLDLIYANKEIGLILNITANKIKNKLESKVDEVLSYFDDTKSL